MRFRGLISGTVALAIISCLTLQTSIPPEVVMSSSEAIKVETLLPDRGTVVFITQKGENPIPGVEIRIDGEGKGFTDEDGRLTVEWLIFGEHLWEALYGEKEVSQGKFEIPKIEDMELIDFYIGKEGKKVNELYPLSKDRIDAVSIVRNTGTVTANRFTVKVTTIPSASTIEIKLIRPKIPQFILNAVMGWMIEMFYTDMGREVIFKEDEVTSTNIFSHELMSFKLEEPFQGEGKRIRTPPEFKGIEPGVIVKMREERPFVDWVKENMNNKASEMGMKMNMEVIDEENGVMHLWVKEYRYGPVKIKDIEAIMQLKGPTKQTYQLFIDDKLCCSWEAEIYYSAKKSIGGETIEEILEKGSIELYKDETSYS